MQAENRGGDQHPARGLIPAAAVAAIAIATVIAVIVTQHLRSEGTVFSATKVYALDNPDREPPGRELKICFRQKRDDVVDVELTDREGRLVRTLASGEELEGDTRHCYRWDGRDEDGTPLPGGRYRLRITLERTDRTAVAGERVQLSELPEGPGGPGG